MSRRIALLASLSLGLALTLPAAAQETGTVIVSVTGVHSSSGNVLANLCGDPSAQFPGGCATYQAMAIATEGATILAFDSVKPGNYALQLFHDEDGNFFPNIPPEGFAYGNDQPFPPSFEKASIKVAGDTSTSVKMVYLPSQAAAPQGGRGAPAPHGVTKTDVREDGLYGEFYVPAHDKPLPVLLVLGGSEGGLMASSRVGVGFTARGYAVLSLAYFAETGLPQTLENVPLEYFDKAIAWLKQQPGVDPKAIGVVGGSRGSEAALLLASRNKDVRAVMAFAPSGIVWQGLNFQDPMHMGPAWTADGKALPFVTPEGRLYRPNAPMKPMFDTVLSQADTRPETVIPVEKINGPVLLISGKADALWPSFDMGERIVRRLKDKGFGHDVQHLSYETAGHMVFMGDPTSAGAISMSKAPLNPSLGGTGEANLNAWTEDWPKVVAFFDKALKGQKQ
jgi:dienelactone hydrolase/uncharacterized protein (DUF2141 family)